MTVAPDQFHRRSFVYPRLSEAGAEFASLEDTAVASHFPDTPAPVLGLVDLSPLPRTGIKGPRALTWLREQGWAVPETNNTATSNGSGSLALRLGDRELLVMATTLEDHDSVREIDAAIPDDGAWHLPRRDSHCLFTLHGEASSACLAKLCGVDLRAARFAAGSVAQTSVARLSAIVCRPPDSDGRTFHLLADSASAMWFWDTLLDAMAEFGGGPLGIHQLA